MYNLFLSSCSRVNIPGAIIALRFCYISQYKTKQISKDIL